MQSAVGKILTDEGYQIISALDGEIGLRLAQYELPDLILLDCILPRKNGFEVLAELKKDPKTFGIPVIILSNLEGSEDIQRMIELGATTYLVKTNYRLEEIMKKIKDTLK